MDGLIKRAEVKLDNIYESLNTTYFQEGFDLYYGKCGIALFNFYYAKYKADQKAYDNGFSLISEIIDAINPDIINYTFSRGFSGICWTIEHLARNNFIDVDCNELLDEADELLYPIMINEVRSGNYDFIRGALGVGQYFLSKRPTAKVSGYLHNLVDELDKTSEKAISGIKWKSVLYAETGEKGYNISLSHGIASIIKILSGIYNRNINKPKAKALLEGAIKYLMNQKNGDNYNSIYPVLSIESVGKPESSRLAWCYGDLGIAIALWGASQALGRKDLSEEAMTTLYHAAKRRNLEKNRVVDARICHGSAGIAQIFYRMYLNTEDEVMKQASDFWYNQTLNMAKFDDGIAGYKTWRSKEYGGWIGYSGLLQGVSGIGLSLLSAVSKDKPGWDECLLLS